MLFLLIWLSVAAIGFVVLFCCFHINADEDQQNEYPETQDDFTASIARWGYVQAELSK